MKKWIIPIVATLLLFIGCQEEGKSPLSNNTKVYVRAQKQGRAISRTQPPGVMSYDDSVRMIVKHAGRCNGAIIEEANIEHGRFYTRGIGDEERDIPGNRFVWFGEDCIYIRTSDYMPELGYRLAYVDDIVLCAFIDKLTGYWYEFGVDDIPDDVWANPDTVAYIPNAMVRQARIDIQKAFDKEDWDECYRLFDEAYKFIPITAERWKELKARGEN